MPVLQPLHFCVWLNTHEMNIFILNVCIAKLVSPPVLPGEAHLFGLRGKQSERKQLQVSQFTSRNAHESLDEAFVRQESYLGRKGHEGLSRVNAMRRLFHGPHRGG